MQRGAERTWKRAPMTRERMVGRPSMASEKRAYTGERATDSRRRASLRRRGRRREGGRRNA